MAALFLPKTPNCISKMEALTIRPRKTRPHKLPAEQREHFIAYFMRRYPITKKIKVGKNADRAYTTRAHYRQNEVNRTIIVHAYTYEALVICMQAAYVSRGF